MDFLLESNKLDKIAPGVTSAYRQLRDSHGQGIYTSLGRYYNHTIFGRDAGMSAKFVSDFDHEAVWQTIVTLAHYQGQVSNSKTQEQPGRIHHELRDYKAWNGRWYDRFGLELAGFAWGMKKLQLCTYFAGDTTATYIRLVNKYAARIDASIFERQVPTKNGNLVPLADSIESAANWVMQQVDRDGVFWSNRTNRWSLPYQTYTDSVTAFAWADGKPADTSRLHSFTEVQVFAMDALEDAADLLPASRFSRHWQETAERMRQATISKFWDGASNSFTPGLFYRNNKVEQLAPPAGATTTNLPAIPSEITGNPPMLIIDTSAELGKAAMSAPVAELVSRALKDVSV